MLQLSEDVFLDLFQLGKGSYLPFALWVSVSSQLLCLLGELPRGHASGPWFLLQVDGESRCRHLTVLLSFQCHFCDKAFMNQAFLQSHIQRRHTAESHLGKA